MHACTGKGGFPEKYRCNPGKDDQLVRVVASDGCECDNPLLVLGSIVHTTATHEACTGFSDALLERIKISAQMTSTDIMRSQTGSARGMARIRSYPRLAFIR